jgi:hypothetical protein
MMIIFMRWWLMMLEVVEMLFRTAAGLRWPAPGPRLRPGRVTHVLAEERAAAATLMVVMEVVMVW